MIIDLVYVLLLFESHKLGGKGGNSKAWAAHVGPRQWGPAAPKAWWLITLPSDDPQPPPKGRQGWYMGDRLPRLRPGPSAHPTSENKWILLSGLWVQGETSWTFCSSLNSRGSHPGGAREGTMVRLIICLVENSWFPSSWLPRARCGETQGAPCTLVGSLPGDGASDQMIYPHRLIYGHYYLWNFKLSLISKQHWKSLSRFFCS